MVSFKEVVRSLEARWFMSSMATGAVGVGLNFLAKSFGFIKYIPSFLVILAILSMNYVADNIICYSL